MGYKELVSAVMQRYGYSQQQAEDFIARGQHFADSKLWDKRTDPAASAHQAQVQALARSLAQSQQNRTQGILDDDAPLDQDVRQSIASRQDPRRSAASNTRQLNQVADGAFKSRLGNVIP